MKARAALSLLLIFALPTTLRPVHAQRSGAGIRLQFPEDVDLAGLMIDYFLKGPFGGFGSFERTQPNGREYVLPTTHEGQRVRSVRAVIYRPGSQIVLFTRDVVSNQTDEIVAVSFQPLASIPLAGRVAGLSDPQGVFLEIVYLAWWSHTFFGIADGAVVSFPIARVSLGADGSFAVRVPDLGQDPSIAGRPAHERGSLSFRVRATPTGNILYSVELADRRGQRALLSVADSYPEQLELVATARQP